jgi:single-strand DNA-binding protein
MANLNTVVICGRLTKDPVCRDPNAGVCNMVVAINYRTKNYTTGDSNEHTDFVPVSVFGRTAELCVEKLHKGSSVLIHGRIRSKSKEINGEKKFFTEVVANKVDFLDRYIKTELIEKLDKDEDIDYDEEVK